MANNNSANGNQGAGRPAKGLGTPKAIAPSMVPGTAPARVGSAGKPANAYGTSTKGGAYPAKSAQGYGTHFGPMPVDQVGKTSVDLTGPSKARTSGPSKGLVQGAGSPVGSGRKPDAR